MRSPSRTASKPVSQAGFKSSRNNISCGKLSALALALGAALAAPDIRAQTTITSRVLWTAGDASIASNMVLNIGANQSGVSATVNSGQTLGVFTNNGAVWAQVNGFVAASDQILGTLVNNGTLSGGSNDVLNQGTMGRLTNSGHVGTIGSGLPFNGIYNNGGYIGTLENTSTGTVFSMRTAINNDNGSTIGTLSNAGMLIGQGTGGIGYANGINNGGVIGKITNSGVISGNTNSTQLAGYGISNSGTIGTLSNQGVIKSDISASGIGLSNTIGGLITLIDNGTLGTIKGLQTGISNAGTIVTLNNSGSIIGTTSHGVDNSGSITTLVNSGYIAGPGTGLNNTGTIGSLTNSGTISGGIYNDGTITALINSGLISSGSGALIYDVHSSVGSLANTGTIAGDISNSTTQALTITGGSGATFGTLTGASGGVGRITSLANVVFSSGNQLLNDNISVNSGNGTVVNSATLQVNNRVTITGNFNQSAGSALLLGVTSPSNTNAGNINDTGYGSLVVVGNAVLASGSTVGLKSLGYAFAQGQRYVVLAATGALTANGVNYSATGFNVTGALQQDTANNTFTDLILTLGGPLSNTPVNNATDGNASAALGGLFHYTGNSAGLLAVFNPAAALGTSGAANKAGAQLSPAANGSAVTQAAQASTQTVLDVTTAHIDTLRVAQLSGSSGSGSGVATGERASDVAVWGQAFGGQANQSDRTGASGYRADYNGLLIGADTALNDQWRAGGLFNYANTSIANTGDNSGSSGHVNSYGVTGYAGYTGETWYLNLSAGVAAQKYSTSRSVGFTGFAGSAFGSFDGTQYVTSAQAGYPIKLDAVTTLTPIGGVTYSRLHLDGYTETGSAMALRIGSSSTSSIKSDLGVKLERSVKTSYGDMTPSAQLSWRHEYRDTGLRSVANFAADTTGSTSFVSQGAAPGKDTGVLVLGVNLARSQKLTLAAHYTLEARGGYTAQTADVRLRYAF